MLTLLTTLGTWAIWLALIACGTSILFYARALHQPLFLRKARLAFLSTGAFIVIASACLWTLILTQHYEILYVWEFTSPDLPLAYRIAAFWNGQQGTFFLWIIYNTIFGAILMRIARGYEAATLLFLAIIEIALIVPCLHFPTLALADNAFGPTPAAQLAAMPNGSGMNLLLQSRWMVIHPYIMFLGYASMGVPFALAMAGLLKRDAHGWVRLAMPFAGLGVAALGTGVTLGGLWSYNVLGWGGYWMWDPVENVSIVPWFTCAALLHGLMLQRGNKSMVRFNLFWGTMTFLCAYYATFFTRTGLLGAVAESSVHTFGFSATGYWLLGLMIAYAIGTWIFYAIRIRGLTTRRQAYPSVDSFQFWLFGGTYSFAACAVLIFVLVSLPLIGPLFDKTFILEPHTYNVCIAPIILFMLIELAMVPFYLVRKTPFARGFLTSNPFWLCTNISIAAMIVALWLGNVRPLAFDANAGQGFGAVIIASLKEAIEPKANWFWSLLLVGIGTMAVCSNTYAMVTRWKRNGFLAGSVFISHIGLALFMIGVVGTDMEHARRGLMEGLLIREGHDAEALGYRVGFESVEWREADDKHVVNLKVSQNGTTFNATPLMWTRDYFQQNGEQMIVRQPFVLKRLLHDVYIEPAEYYPNEKIIELSQRPQQTKDGKLLRMDEVPLGDWTVRFLGFELLSADNGHLSDGESFKAGAKMEILHHGIATPFTLWHEPGGQRLVDEPAQADGSPITVALDNINAAQKEIVLRLKGIDGRETPHFVELSHGETTKVNDWEVTFVRFQKLSAEELRAMEAGKGFRISVIVKMQRDGQVLELKPAVWVADPRPKAEHVRVPNTPIVAWLEGMDADTKTVRVHLTGIGNFMTLNILIKPLINLARLGIFLLLSGALLSSILRFGKNKRQNGTPKQPE